MSVQPGLISGTVLDESGNPVQGAVVVVKRQSDNQTFETTTDASGFFEFTGLPGGEYHAMARYDNSVEEFNSLSKPYLTVESAIPDSGGTHQWNVSEGNGTTVADSIGTLDGTTNATWTAETALGDTTLTYDATDDFTDLGTASRSALSYIWEGAAATISVWFKWDGSGGDNVIFGNEQTGSGQGFLLLKDTNDALSFRVMQSQSNINGGTITSGEWTMASVTKATNGDTEIYLDDTQVASGNVTTNPGDAQDFNICFGAADEGADRQFVGEIDLAFVDDANRGSQGIQDWYNETKEIYQ